jgi:NAD(P)-dependent dehydrogenase (short-subunit alcohol dehydrogenase family)
MLLQDKVCVIVGAASRRSIGYATAELFAEHGAKVVLADVAMDEQVLSALKSAIEAHVKGPASVHGVRCDISQAQDCDALVADVVALHGTIDCLVNSAGIVRSQSILEISEKGP